MVGVRFFIWSGLSPDRHSHKVDMKYYFASSATALRPAGTRCHTQRDPEPPEPPEPLELNCNLLFGPPIVLNVAVGQSEVGINSTPGRVNRAAVLSGDARLLVLDLGTTGDKAP
jgi:hypothetical protein